MENPMNKWIKFGGKTHYFRKHAYAKPSNWKLKLPQGETTIFGNTQGETYLLPKVIGKWFVTNVGATPPGRHDGSNNSRSRYPTSGEASTERRTRGNDRWCARNAAWEKQRKTMKNTRRLVPWLLTCGTLEVEELQKNCSHTCPNKWTMNLRRSHPING